MAHMIHIIYIYIGKGTVVTNYYNMNVHLSVESQVLPSTNNQQRTANNKNNYYSPGPGFASSLFFLFLHVGPAMDGEGPLSSALVIKNAVWGPGDCSSSSDSRESKQHHMGFCSGEKECWLLSHTSDTFKVPNVYRMEILEHPPPPPTPSPLPIQK